jgi:hypothetical protein
LTGTQHKEKWQGVGSIGGGECAGSWISVGSEEVYGSKTITSKSQKERFYLCRLLVALTTKIREFGLANCFVFDTIRLCLMPLLPLTLS